MLSLQIPLLEVDERLLAAIGDRAIGDRFGVEPVDDLVLDGKGEEMVIQRGCSDR